MYINNNKNSGFSLVELMVVVAIFFILAGISTSVYSNLKNKNNLDIAQTSVVQGLRRAQVLSMSSKGDSTWGVYLTNEEVKVFKGANFSGREAALDESLSLPPGISIGGNNEIVFSKFYGVPNPTGTTTLVGQWGVKNIIINEKGVISY